MPPCCLFYSSYFTNLYSFFIEVICMKYTFLPYYFLLCIFQQISKIQKSVLSNTNRSVIVELYFNVSPGYNPMLEFIRWLSVSIQNGKRSEGRDPPSAWQSVETQPQPWQGEHRARQDPAHWLRTNRRMDSSIKDSSEKNKANYNTNFQSFIKVSLDR